MFLGFVLEKDQKCKDYINTIGYKNRNIGIISHFVVSEIFIKLITMIHIDNSVNWSKKINILRPFSTLL